MSNASLLIFIKNPEKGKAKTRLAATLGAERALAIYLELLEYTKEVTQPLDSVHKRLYYSRFIDNTDGWDATIYQKYIQQGKDLGERMEAGFRDAFADGLTRVVIIGSDCGELNTKHLQSAFKALETHDFVIGPAEDGGYYLLGMRTFLPYVFHNKQWSTAGLLEVTLADIASKDHTVALLEKLSDIDYEADYLKWIKVRKLES